MLQTDLNGLMQEMRTNRTWHLVFLILGCFIGFYLINKYFYPSKNEFGNIIIGTVYANGGNRCDSTTGFGGNVPGLDKALIENEINLPNRNPAFLTSSMVIPEIRVSDEERRKTRMEVLNMFYSTNDDDATTINNRPRGLYLIP